MRVDLGSLEGIDTELRLPVAEDGTPKHVRVQRLASLSGVLETHEGTVRLTDVSAGEVHLGAAHWAFGTVEVVSPRPCSMAQVQLGMEVRSEEPLDLELHAGMLDFSKLEVHVGDTHVSGVARFEGASLRLAEGQGTIRAESGTVSDLRVQIGALTLKVPQLRVSVLEIGWGDPDGFWMRAERAQGGHVGVALESVDLGATAVDMHGFEFKHAGLYILSLVADSLKGKLELAPAAPEAVAKEVTARPSRPTFDLDVLDALEGKLVADTRFEIRLPGGLRRKLHIPLSLDVVEGSIDYRALEHSLPRFEDSLLDFSHQDDWLVLELGLPLLPTRGYGKQLMRWPLRPPNPSSGGRSHQVRLSALPRFERPESRKSRPPSPRESTSGGQSSVRLDSASIELGPMQLRLPPPSQYLDAAVEMLTFESLELEGKLAHESDETPAGEIVGRGTGLEVRLDDLTAGEKLVGASAIVQRVIQLRAETQGFRPRTLHVEVEGVRVNGVKYA